MGEDGDSGDFPSPSVSGIAGEMSDVRERESHPPVEGRQKAFTGRWNAARRVPYPLRVMKAKFVAPAFADNSSQFSVKSGRLACLSAAVATAAQ